MSDLPFAPGSSSVQGERPSAGRPIVAPFDGFVAAEFTEVGAWISQGDPVAQIVQLDEVEIQVPTTAQNAVRLRRGDTIRIEFPELPGQLFIGKFERIVPMADTRSRTFPIYIRMKNQVDDGVPLLLAGMLARVDLPTGQRKLMPLVSKDALVLNEDKCSVFVVDVGTNSKATKPIQPDAGQVVALREVPVELGVASGELIQIRGEVGAGDWVVTLGNERLDDKDEVAIQRVIENEETSKPSVPDADAEK